jgi:CPA1 family monovalent cation:H+ antiporter
VLARARRNRQDRGTPRACGAEEDTMSTAESLQTVLLLVGALLLFISSARRLPIPHPVLLVLGGLALGLVPGAPRPRLDPDLVFLVFLPPILWAAAYFTSLRDFRANARPIALLAIGLVLATTAAVAALAHALLPGLGWAGAVALGAIVSPPDAVAATAVVRKLGVPRRIVTILEGESLVNDATALVLYRAALAAVVAGVFDPFDAVGTFFFAAGAGVAIGLAVGALALGALRVGPDPLVQTAVTLLAPYVAWTLGERAHASPVLACVAGGLLLRQSLSLNVTPSMRLQSRAVWDFVLFALNGMLFLLIGLQLPSLIADVPHDQVWQLLGFGLAVSAAAIATRLAWVPLMTWLPRKISRALRARDPMPPWPAIFLTAWTGLRGAVSLAAALALPMATAGGAPLPHRSELILITFVVIFCTLVVQGASLGPLVRRLPLPSEDIQDREEQLARTTATRAALARLDALAGERWTDAAVLGEQRAFYERRLGRYGSDGEGPQSLLSDRAAQRTRYETLVAERLALVELRDDGSISDEVLVELEAELDLEAARNGLADASEAPA